MHDNEPESIWHSGVFIAQQPPPVASRAGPGHASATESRAHVRYLYMAIV
jgi:hypothetical protein